VSLEIREGGGKPFRHRKIVVRSKRDGRGKLRVERNGYAVRSSGMA
jgi:hypothetical protein